MDISKVTELISASAFFLLVVAVLVLLFKLPKWLSILAPKLSIKRLKVGGVEAELAVAGESKKIEGETEADGQSSSVAPAPVAVPEAGSPIVSPEDALRREAQEDPFTRSYLLLAKGEYDDGIAAMKEFAATLTEPEKREDYLAFARYTGVTHGNSRALDELKVSAEQSPQNAAVRHWYAKALLYVGSSREATQQLERSFRDAQPEGIPDIAISLAEALWEMDRKDEAVGKLAEAAVVADFAGKSKLYAEIARRYSLGQDPDHAKVMAMYELAVRSNPSDKDLRFKVAYQYSNNGMPALALCHYKWMLAMHGVGGAYFNNAGVVAFGVSLPILGMELYRKAEAKGESLAMSNIASKMLSVGLIQEAREVLGRARECGDVHERVSLVEGEIAKKQQEERERLSQVEENARRLGRWSQEYAEAMLEKLDDPAGLSGLYVGKPGDVELDVAPNGRVTGKTSSLHFSSGARIWGLLDGRALRISWEAVDSTVYFRQAGHGVLVVKDDGGLVGYSVRGDSRDAAKVEDWREWKLARKQEE